MNLKEEVHNFKLWLTRLGYAQSTIKSYVRLLQNFFNYLNGEKPTQQKIEQLNKYLHQRKFSRQYISSHINVINRYSAFLELTTKRKLTVGKIIIEKQIITQRAIFSQKEVSSLFSSIDGHSPIGLLDRAILSIYYGCGLRCKEGILLETKELDFHRGLLYVKPSKNYSSRYVPMSKQVMKDLQEYNQFAREIINPKSNYVLVGKQKECTNGESLNRRIRFLMQQAGIEKKASLHSLRHSIATHLLQKGMELEYIGRFLGHTSLDATQIYVRMNQELLGES